MNKNLTFELFMVLDTKHFHRIFARAYNLQELDGEYVDTSLVEKGITVVYRDSQYKKKVKLFINTGMIVDDLSDTDKLIRKLDTRITEYFNRKYRLDNFTLSGVTFTIDIDVKSRANVLAYLKVLQRVGKVKGFSPVSYNWLDNKSSFCLSGNSNNIDFLLYDLERAVMNQLSSTEVNRKKIESVCKQAKGILRAEVHLTKPKAIRDYTNGGTVSDQIVELTKNSTDAFMKTFTQIIPFGDFYKKENAIEMIRKEVKDTIMQRKMLRLMTLIPEKKSIYLAQKTMDCRNIEKVMGAFVKINLSPVTLSKRHEVKTLDNLYSYLL